MAVNNNSFAQDEFDKNIYLLLDITLSLSIVLGKAQMKVEDILKLDKDSVVTLDKLQGEPAEIYANSKLVAKGEVVVVNEKFGIRVTEVLNPLLRKRMLDQEQMEQGEASEIQSEQG
ncbi:MAG: flagellar motor switch protein FliN [Desulfobacterales bacterium]|nr:flagellar motor switch protein FliN [Desulfobacterales bacterium]